MNDEIVDGEKRSSEKPPLKPDTRPTESGESETDAAVLPTMSNLASGRPLLSVALLDTSIASTNLGDEIIMEAVRRHLTEILPDASFSVVATHERMGRKSRSLIDRATLAFVGGSSLLSSRMWLKSVWQLSPLDALKERDVVLMGVGWYQFQRKPDPYSRWLLRRFISRDRLHAVRDEYSKQMLESIGIKNVVNTGCPTMWNLTEEHCHSIPHEQAESVVTTLNTYMPDERLDAQFLRLLRRHYRQVYFWVQTQSDFDYSKRLDPDLIYLKPRLNTFDELLRSKLSLDYVGNRLHAGLRALAHQRRSVIIEIDNRAHGIGKDFGVPTVKRSDLEGLERMITGRRETRIELPAQTIEQWKNEYRSWAVPESGAPS